MAENKTEEKKVEEKQEQEGAQNPAVKNYFIAMGLLSIVSILTPVLLASKYSADTTALSGRAVISSEERELLAPEEASLENLIPVSKEDRILGSKKAKVQIISYSDYLCPFCARFHETMEEVLADYSDKEVAWVYRHLPIIGGQTSRDLALVSECVADEKGDKAFFDFTDWTYANVDEVRGLSLDTLKERAVTEFSLNSGKLDKCVGERKFDDKINDQTDGAFALGANGTPFSVVLLSDGTKYEVNGAQSAATIHSLIKRGLE